MGQTPSTFRRVNSRICQEDTNDEVWSEVVHVSDRDVLVKDIGGKRQQKVKLSGGRKCKSMDNVRLMNKRCLEGMRSSKQGKDIFSEVYRGKDNIKVVSSAELINHRYIQPENRVKDSTMFVPETDTRILANKLVTIIGKSRKEEQRSEYHGNNQIKTWDNAVTNSELRYQRFPMNIDKKTAGQDYSIEIPNGRQKEDSELATVRERVI